jgi:hypothetical protein
MLSEVDRTTLGLRLVLFQGNLILGLGCILVVFLVINVIRVLYTNRQYLFLAVPINNAFINANIALFLWVYSPDRGVNLLELVYQII